MRNLPKSFIRISFFNNYPRSVAFHKVRSIAFCRIERNFREAGVGNYAVEDLGKDAGMSRTQLYRKLKAITGQSANEFIRTMRLKRAAQLLEQQQLTVAEVTYEVGFTDLQHFRECFKKLFGVTPSEYAQRGPENPA
ncbi:helix-turn-helix transcriptional regulator [Pseudochryseolinea flava]|uniref:helix-turn-helix transcriptional regulator n=1 Tax=Pseudochryseolinea flava TaxID=2059302 RepID=UPI001057E090|nr:helix-turn-helix transcriptional regulator [Pseudochryseolinea flava]